MLWLGTNLTEGTTWVAERRANKALLFCVAVMIATMLKLLLAANPAQASTFSVTNTDDSGAGSLRQAITDAGTDVGTIKFHIPSTDTGCDATSGVCTIDPSSEPLETTGPVVIDGYSQGPP